MADNIELDAGTGGAVIATDDDATAHHQYVKVEFGPDNTQTKVTVTEGLPIQNDDTDLKITLDSEAVVLGAGTAEIGKLAASTAAIGKLAANSGVDIGDVDVTSSALPTGAATAAKQLADGHNVTVDNGAAGAAINIQDGGNSITIDGAVTADLGANNDVTIDGSSVVSVDDTTTHTAGTTEGINIMAVATPTGTVIDSNDIGMVAMSLDRRLHVDADITASVTLTVDGSGVTQPVSAASLPLPSGAATSAAQLADGHNVTIDNAGGVEVVQLTAGDLNMTEASAAGILTDTGVIASDTTSIDGKITACDTGAVVVTALPRSQIGPAEPGTAIDSYTQKAINLTTGADQVLVASAANKQIWVYGYQFTCGTADGQSVSFQDQDDVALSGIMKFAQYGGASVAPSGNFSMPIWKLGTDKDLEIDIVGGDVDGWITYAILSV